MKRHKFIAALMATAAMPFVSFAGAAKRHGKPFKIAAGEGRLHGHIQLKGVNANVIDVKISGSDTDGDLAVFEQTSLSQGRGTPLHIHPAQDEIFQVQEGAYKFKVGDEFFDLTVGDRIFLPRNVPHAWTQVSARGKMTVILQPAGKLEAFFVTVAALTHEPSAEEMAKIFLDSEMIVVGPPLKLE